MALSGRFEAVKVCLSRTSPRAFGGSPLLTPLGWLLEALAEGRECGGVSDLNAVAVVGPRTRAAGSIIDPQVREQEAQFLAAAEELPTVRWSPSRRSLSLSYRGELGQEVVESAPTVATLRSAATELVRAFRQVRPLLQRKRKLKGDELLAVVDRLPEVVPSSEEKLADWVIASTELHRLSRFTLVQAGAERESAKPARRLSDIRVYSGLGNECAEARRVLAGATLDGGVSVDPAGPWLHVLCEAFKRALHTAGLALPGFSSVYLACDSVAAAGTIRIYREDVDWVRWIELGLTVDQLRSLCRGDDHEAGVHFVASALLALAKTYSLDETVIRRAGSELVTAGREGLAGIEVGYPPMYNRRV
ncbi:MAG: hypothetical protein JKY37_31575 [Nannocystaceae bacterium]|nr:hypothetical protein [Nannocystaceae bacterium]